MLSDDLFVGSHVFCSSAGVVALTTAWLWYRTIDAVTLCQDVRGVNQVVNEAHVVEHALHRCNLSLGRAGCDQDSLAVSCRNCTQKTPLGRTELAF